MTTAQSVQAAVDAWSPSRRTSSSTCRRPGEVAGGVIEEQSRALEAGEPAERLADPIEELSRLPRFLDLGEQANEDVDGSLAPACRSLGDMCGYPVWRPGLLPDTRSGEPDDQKTIALSPSTSTRSSRWLRTARASTTLSTSRPTRSRSAAV